MSQHRSLVKKNSRGWRDDCGVKNTCCFYEGLRFDSQHWYSASETICNSSVKGSDPPLLDTVGTNHLHGKHAYKQATIII